MRKELVTKKCNRAQQHHNFRVFYLLQKLVRFLLAAVQNLSLFIVTERSHVSDGFNLRAAEIDFFLLRWLRIYQQKLADRDNFIYHALQYLDIKVPKHGTVIRKCLALLKLQKFLGNICSFEQLFYRIQSLGAPEFCKL